MPITRRASIQQYLYRCLYRITVTRSIYIICTLYSDNTHGQTLDKVNSRRNRLIRNGPILSPPPLPHTHTLQPFRLSWSKPIYRRFFFFFSSPHTAPVNDCNSSRPIRIGSFTPNTAVYTLLLNGRMAVWRGGSKYRFSSKKTMVLQRSAEGPKCDGSRGRGHDT
jgi:hypothetical protein